MNELHDLIDKLKAQQVLSKQEFKYLLENLDENSKDYLIKAARDVTNSVYGKSVYMRGLIEISNYCTRDCNYCGIRKDNDSVSRYRLSKQQILECCEVGYNLGFKTIVMQGGEDPYYTKEVLSDIIKTIKSKYDVAITLSIGERTKEDYQAFYNAGADRFLLRHETATKSLYEHLHPSTMSFTTRQQCLYDLKEIGFQVGAGFMVGSPKQTVDDLVDDLLFLHKLQPAMCGIGPYICHEETPFKGCENGSVDLSIIMLAVVRLILPNCLLPATTALGTLSKDGRERALLAGGNVVMPNLSPIATRKDYEIYQNKSGSNVETVQNMKDLTKKIQSVGLEVDMSVGHTKMEGYNVYKQ